MSTGVRQTYNPNLAVAALRGYCLKYIDDSGNAPTRRPSAQAAYAAEKAASRLHTDVTPVGVWVAVFVTFTRGNYVNLGHVFWAKNLGGGRYDMRDSETRSGARVPYTNMDQLLAWFGAYSPRIAGWSFTCDGRTYGEFFNIPAPAPNPTPTPGVVRKAAKGTATVLTGELNVRNSPSTGAAIIARYSKGDKFTYDSYIVCNGFVWLSYISYSGLRRYVAEGPNDGNNNTVYVSGGV